MIGFTLLLLAVQGMPQALVEPAVHDRIVGYRLHIGVDGRVKDCTVTRSSGDSAIDKAACKALTLRSRFKPARDNYGNAIEDTYEGTVKWRVEDESFDRNSTQ